MLSLARAVIAVAAALFVAVGLYVALPEDQPLPGIVMAAIGGVALVAIALERMRYGAAAEEAEIPTDRPPGGESADAPMDPRFRATDEVFIDPTSARRMRVYVDPRSGERRYRAET